MFAAFFPIETYLTYVSQDCFIYHCKGKAHYKFIKCSNMTLTLWSVMSLCIHFCEGGNIG